MNDLRLIVLDNIDEVGKSVNNHLKFINKIEKESKNNRF